MFQFPTHKSKSSTDLGPSSGYVSQNDSSRQIDRSDFNNCLVFMTLCVVVYFFPPGLLQRCCNAPYKIDLRRGVWLRLVFVYKCVHFEPYNIYFDLSPTLVGCQQLKSEPDLNYLSS